MIILVINCGSSSIKYQLLDMKNDDVYDIIAKGIAEKIGLPAGILQYAPTGRDKIVKDIPIPDHKVGMQLILAALTDPETGVLSSLEDIEAVATASSRAAISSPAPSWSMTTSSRRSPSAATSLRSTTRLTCWASTPCRPCSRPSRRS